MASNKNRQTLLISADQLDDLSRNFDNVDSDGNGYITESELGEALKTCGISLPAFKVRDIISEFDRNNDGNISLQEFKSLYTDLKTKMDLNFKGNVKEVRNINTHPGMTSISNEGTTHTVRIEEQVAFTNWINRNLEGDSDCVKYLPLSHEGSDLYDKCRDGIILCKMVNKSCPDTIDERTINKSNNLSIFKRTENLILALNSAQSIGCYIVNIGADDLDKAKPHLLLGLLWQIIRIGLLADINLQHNPGLINLLEEGETIEDLMRLSPEAILIRWVNYHLSKAGVQKRISNLTSDIKDSEAYIHLLGQIAPREAEVRTGCVSESNLEQRAEYMLQEANKIGCRSFVTPKDVTGGVYKLNLAFVANLFNQCPALDQVEGQEIEIIEETREEKTRIDRPTGVGDHWTLKNSRTVSRDQDWLSPYRNWMNSLGVPYVSYIYNDLRDGCIIFKLYDKIRDGSVDWKRVHSKFNKLKANFEKLENCNYAVELGSKLKFSLVGIGGQDIREGNQTLTLALIWQLMRAYTLAMLSNIKGDGLPVVDAEIVAWANEKLKNAGKKTSFSSFQDHRLSDGRVIIDLVDAIRPRFINYDLVREGTSEENKEANAKYAISMSRKMGARVYALAEDITEVKPKMIMTIFACLMVKDMQAKEVSMQ